MIARAPTFGTRQVAFGIGHPASHSAIGLLLRSDNRWQVYYGDSSDNFVAYTVNSPSNTWRSFLINYTSGGVDVYHYTNGAYTSSFSFGSTITLANPIGWSLGAAPDNSLPATVDIGAAIYFPAALASNGSVAAPLLHNLFAAQYGLALV